MTDRVSLCLVVALAVGAGVSCKPDTADESSSSSTNAERPVARPSARAQASARPAEDSASPLAGDAGSESTEIQLTEEILERGSQAYQAGMCFKCHRDEGTGGARAPDLTDAEWLHCDGSVEGIRQVLTNGVSREQLKDPDREFAMNPATNLVPDEAQIAALAAYVYSLSRS